jgi:hypothetical protein
MIVSLLRIVPMAMIVFAAPAGYIIGTNPLSKSVSFAAPNKPFHLRASYDSIDTSPDPNNTVVAPTQPKQQVETSSPAPSLREGIYEYVVIDQDLSVVLLEFAHHFNLQIDIDREIRGRLRDRLPPSTGEEYLNRLAEQNQFDWYFDGQVLRITPLRQTTTRIISAKSVDIKDVRATLDKLGISDKRHPLITDELTGLIKVTGPPQFNAVVESIIGAIQKKKAVAVEPAADSPTSADVAEPIPESIAPPKQDKSVIIYRGSESTEVQIQ